MFWLVLDLHHIKVSLDWPLWLDIKSTTTRHCVEESKSTVSQPGGSLRLSVPCGIAEDCKSGNIAVQKLTAVLLSKTFGDRI